MSLWRGTKEQRACCLVFDTHLKAPCSPSVEVPVVVSNCLLVFEGYSLPHPCLQAKFRPYPYLLSFSLFLLSSSPHSSAPSLAQSAITLSFLLSVAPSLHPLRAAGFARSVLQRSELITCILDRRATWGHTLPGDRSIHAGGNRGTRAGGKV